jgi:two-component system OmpR family response regulator
MATILVIDPDPHYREYLRLVLERAGYAVSALADGASLQQILGAAPVDAVLADVDPPAGVIGTLRALAPGLPVIAMSGDNPDPSAASRFGADAVIGKPARSADIVAVLLRVLRAPPP